MKLILKHREVYIPNIFYTLNMINTLNINITFCQSIILIVIHIVIVIDIRIPIDIVNKGLYGLQGLLSRFIRFMRFIFYAVGCLNHDVIQVVITEVNCIIYQKLSILYICDSV